MNVRRRNNIQKWMKDYMVPLIGLFLIIILLLSVFSWDSTPEKIDLENKVWMEVQLNWLNAESYVVYPWGLKKKIDWEISLYKWEKLMVKDGSVSLSLVWLWNFRLNKLGELKYLENGDFSLYSWDLWLNSEDGVNVDMRFASVKVWNNSNISFSQNEMGSTVYLVNWFAEVVNLAWESTVLASGQKITISRLDANKDDIDLSINKENIDDYYKQSDWFIINNGSKYLWIKSGDIETWTWTEKTNNSISSSSNLITFSNLTDESNVSADTITITWNYFDDEITKIVVNWKSAKLNKELKTFKFTNVLVWEKVNDLVFKIYDDANDILSRFVYTVYYSWGKSTSSSSGWAFNVKTFDVDGTQFTFTSPTSKSTFTTYDDFVTIRWKVLVKWIWKVTVNDYTLNSFNWSTWRYHASTANNNLSYWTNVYEIKYYSAEWKIVYTNHFTIIRKKVVKTEVKKISWEAKID